MSVRPAPAGVNAHGSGRTPAASWLHATPRLRRALRDDAEVELELSGFRDVESDFGKDRRGTYVWRITL